MKIQLIDNHHYSKRYLKDVEKRVNEITYPFVFEFDVKQADLLPVYSHVGVKISEKTGEPLIYRYILNEWAQALYSDEHDGTIILFNDKQWKGQGTQNMGGERTDPLNGHFGVAMTASNKKEMIERMSHELRHCITRDVLKVPDDTHKWDYTKKDLKGGWAALQSDTDSSELIVIVHHTATPRDTTNIQAIIDHHKQKYGRAYYPVFIDRNGNIIRNHYELNSRIGGFSDDPCVIGDFTKEEPTQAQLESLHAYIAGRDYLGHGDADEYGATASLCPGKLLSYLEKYRTKQKPQINWIALLKLVYMSWKDGKLTQNTFIYLAKKILIHV